MGFNSGFKGLIN